MNISRFLIAAGLAATVAACGGKDTAPAQPAPAPAPAETAPAPAETAPAPAPAEPAPGAGVITPEDEALVERVLAYFDALSQAASSAGTDCDLMANNINETVAAHDLDTMWAEMERIDQDEAKGQALEQKYGARVEAAITPLMQALSACGENPAVQQALQAAMPQ